MNITCCVDDDDDDDKVRKWHAHDINFPIWFKKKKKKQKQKQNKRERERERERFFVHNFKTSVVIPVFELCFKYIA